MTDTHALLARVQWVYASTRASEARRQAALEASPQRVARLHAAGAKRARRKARNANSLVLRSLRP
jgi:hypothetical protein